MINEERLFPHFPVIEIGEFTLRQLEPSDYQEIYDIYSDEEVMKYQSEGAISRIKQAQDYITFINGGYESKYFVRWAITKKNENKVIGLIILHHIDYRNFNASIGYILNKNYWHQNIMSTVLSEMINFFFKELNFHRLEVSIHPENIASIRLAENVGFSVEGVVKECLYNEDSDKFEDRVVMGLLLQH